LKKTWDERDIWLQLGRMMAEIRSPYTDGFTGSCIKQELFHIKCFLDEEYSRLPRFSDEDHWEKQRTFDLLKRP
jgi:hypothetical protein